MENEILKYVITQGIFAVLFVYPLFYVLKENSKREVNYQSIIEELSKKFNIIENVQEDVKDIKKYIFKN
ncbi:bacteriocin [Tissierella sp. MSJ-40]|uniref:Bacteriocin n=1 Tax=Tissierella simiarum TaxID=2841534 RepID=A0ABS6EB19_9FIRM|nr:BhlA/UviB family holin-like peptide [Tissierella simiarum]MBU5439630.1 bacteriocin [Tissierella simiarum]